MSRQALVVTVAAAFMQNHKNDERRIDAFFARLRDDPDLAALAIVLGPYRAMTRDPAALVATLNALAAHWAAANHAATVEAEI